MLKRLFPSRWARIVAWTAAAVAWGTSILTVQAARQPAAAEPELVPEPEVQEAPEQMAAVPAMPEEGLVVIRYTPVPPPPPEVVTRTVTVGGGGGGGGGSTAASGGGGGSTSRPSINAVSSGS
ncbi:MAG: hypothetical protein GY720_07925 [bacterium]|nr:hypothetical protein [bacterium]